MTAPFSVAYLHEASARLADLALRYHEVERVATRLSEVRDRGGRLFVLGLGGSAAHATHAANDFRKLCGFEAYAPTDGIAELTARANDDGFLTCLSAWLKGSRVSERDGCLFLSVSGESPALVEAARYVHSRSTNCAIVGRCESALESLVGADYSIVVCPNAREPRRTPHTEGLMSVVLHALVSHPLLQVAIPAWERANP